MPLVFSRSLMRKAPAPTPRLDAHRRTSNPPGMRLTDRDRVILHTLYCYDGLLSVDQIHRWFFPGAGNKRNAQRRVSLLFHNRYIQRPTRQRLHRLPEPIVWLDELGAEVVAEQLGVKVVDLPWRKEPRWGDVAHDIGQNEFRRTVELAAQKTAAYTLDTWHGRDELWRRVGRKPIAYRDQSGKRQEKRVVPDGYFRLGVTREGQTHFFRFLLEFDNGTFSNPRFARDKVSPNMHLVLSEGYQRHMGAKGGRFLVVVNGGDERFNHLCVSVTQAGGAPYFLFAQSNTLTVENVLDEPVWQLPHHDRRVSLVEYGAPEFQQWLTASVCSRDNGFTTAPTFAASATVYSPSTTTSATSINSSWSYTHYLPPYIFISIARYAYTHFENLPTDITRMLIHEIEKRTSAQSKAFFKIYFTRAFVHLPRFISCPLSDGGKIKLVDVILCRNSFGIRQHVILISYMCIELFRKNNLMISDIICEVVRPYPCTIGFIGKTS